jgi:hypothetical protein
LNGRSPLHRLATITRDFGFAVAARVIFSKLRGRLFPALALPDAPAYDAPHREVSFLLGTVEHGAATLEGVIAALAGRGGMDWEVCVCERAPVAPETERALARVRGSRPWIRIVRADASVAATTAAQWAVEQATGRFVALVAPGYAPDTGAVAELLARLHGDSTIDSAVLVGTDPGSGNPPSAPRPTDCLMMLQKKSAYLAAGARHWPLTAPALAESLATAGALAADTVAFAHDVTGRAGVSARDR